jgi:hypothetical protein
MVTGRRIRRRRQTVQVIGSGLAIAAVVAVGVTTASALDNGPTRTTVAAQPDPTVAPAVRPTSNAARLLEALGGAPWVQQGDQVVLPKGSTPTDPLPSEQYSAAAGISVVTQAQFDAVCHQAGAVPCVKDEAPGGGEIYRWGYADRDDTANAIRGERAIYVVRDDGRIVLASLRLDGTGGPGEVAPAKAWLEHQDDALVSAATDPRMEFPADG